MTPKEIANIPTYDRREAEIVKYGEKVHEETKRLIDNYLNKFSTFVQDYRELRRAQSAYFKAKKSGDENTQDLLIASKDLEKKLDLKASELFKE